jgi:hypothetical protein
LTHEVKIQRAPIATAYRVDWWQVGGARFMQRMSEADKAEWRRIAHTFEIPANLPLRLPDERRHTEREWVYVLESGRARWSLFKPPETNPKTPKSKTKDAESEKPVAHLVLTLEAGDLTGNLILPSRRESPIRPVQMETLRDCRFWRVTPDLLRQYLWKRPNWLLPPPFASYWKAMPARLADVLDRQTPPGSLALGRLCGRTLNSRAAFALLELLRRGSRFNGKAHRLETRLTVSQLARRIGAEVEWMRRWVAYAKSEGVLKERFGVWQILQQWRLHQWEERRSMEQVFDLPPDPVEQIHEADVSLGRASRTADGTTPEPPTPPSPPVFE